MIALLAAEIRKLTSVRSTWIITLVGLALVAVQALTSVVAGLFTPFIGSSDQVADAIGSIGGNSAIPLVIGLLSMTTEFRHGTVGRTLQLTPSRTRVLVAKLTAGAGYGVAFVLLSVVTVAATLVLGAVVQGVSLEVDGAAIEAFGQALVGMVLATAIGVAFGALVRAQVVAIVVALIWIFVVEQLAFGLLPEVGRWLPFQALNGVFLSDTMAAQMPGQPLVGGVGLAVFTAYVVVFTVTAGVLLRYRDV